MKKTLIALAAVAVSSAAFAQSTVTLYGKANIGLYSVKGSSVALENGPDGSSSRWGLRGTEDLGGGMKANYLLESGFSLDSGNSDNTANQLFQRGAWMGLSGGFGEVRLGRQYTLGFDTSIATMPSTAFSAQTTVGLGFNGVSSRNSDMIKYISPSFGGVKVMASTQLSGDTTKAATAAKKNSEFAISYAAGPLKANLNTLKVSGVSGTTFALNATYDMGVASVTGGYTDKAGKGQGKGFQVGVSMPMGSLTPYVAVARNSDIAGINPTSTKSATSVELGAFYALSKRTRIYGLMNNMASVSYVTAATATAAAKDSVVNKNNRYAIGLDHSF